MSKILIVDDERRIREGLADYIKFMGYEVESASNGEEAVRLCREHEYDVVVMDIMMPKMNGFEACKLIKKEKDIPILMLSARDEEYDKLYGFELGIDDYVVKPFSPKEVLARIRVIINRNARGYYKQQYPPMEEFGGIKINYFAHTVTIDGEPVAMTPKEYELFVYLVRNKGIALSRERLLDEVWGYDFHGDFRTVDTHIKMLRNTLRNYRDVIKTVRGVGYKFET